VEPENPWSSVVGGGGLGLAQYNQDLGAHAAEIYKLDLPCKYSSENAAISALLEATGNYQTNRLPYTARPDDGEAQYNSNSFVSGLLLTTGFELPSPMNNVIGFNNPVPAGYFQPNIQVPTIPWTSLRP
jgi:hypothetical protein